MRALKTLVITLGALIFIGLAVVVVTLIQRSGGDKPEASAEGGTARHAVFGDVRIALPQGARVLKTEIAGDRLIVHLGPSGADFAGPKGPGPKGARLLVIDLDTGRKLGVIELAPK